jgi:uncharacterized membrane protein
MESEFRQGRFMSGVLEGIAEVTADLAAHFPLRGPHRNELPDPPVVL